MATKQLNTRIRVRYDTLTNWNNNNPDLLKGEIAVVEVSAGDQVNQPAYLIKVGTGESGTTTSYGGATGQPAINKTSFKALPYITAEAGDVYGWAKTPNKPNYKSTEIIVETASALGTALGLSANSTLDAVVASIKGGLETNSNTEYDLQVGDGTNGGNPGQIRFGSKDATVIGSSFTFATFIQIINSLGLLIVTFTSTKPLKFSLR